MKNADKHIIFVGGIHGVGKSFICNQVSAELGLSHLEASKIIYSADSQQEDQRTNTRKEVDTVLENQARLIRGLNRLVDLQKWYLLDGHLTIIDSTSGFVQLPSDIFQKINPAGLIVLIDDPRSIASRLKSRDRTEYQIKFLERMQDLEIEHARSISNGLQRPLFIIKTDEISEFRDAIVKIMSKQRTIN